MKKISLMVSISVNLLGTIHSDPALECAVLLGGKIILVSGSSSQAFLFLWALSGVPLKTCGDGRVNLHPSGSEEVVGESLSAII